MDSSLSVMLDPNRGKQAQREAAFGLLLNQLPSGVAVSVDWYDEDAVMEESVP